MSDVAGWDSAIDEVAKWAAEILRRHPGALISVYKIPGVGRYAWSVEAENGVELYRGEHATVRLAWLKVVQNSKGVRSDE